MVLQHPDALSVGIIKEQINNLILNTVWPSSYAFDKILCNVIIPQQYILSCWFRWNEDADKITIMKPKAILIRGSSESKSKDWSKTKFLRGSVPAN